LTFAPFWFPLVKSWNNQLKKFQLLGYKIPALGLEIPAFEPKIPAFRVKIPAFERGLSA